MTGCEVERKQFECRVDGNNGGCQKSVACTDGKHIVGAIAACNLEHGDVSDAELAGVSLDTVKVIRASDDAGQGSCSMHTTAVSTGQADVEGLPDRTSITVKCKEHDKNGGDCQVRGALFCH
jgi:hypothetical protein